jgi:hypothetical protein
MQSGVLLRCMLRRHFGGVAWHNSALRIISVLQITAKRTGRTRSDPRTLGARKAAPCKARRDQRVKWRALRAPRRTQERRAGSGLRGDRRRGADGPPNLRVIHGDGAEHRCRNVLFERVGGSHQKGRSTLGAVHGLGYTSQSYLSWYRLLWKDSAGRARAYQQPDTTSARGLPARNSASHELPPDQWIQILVPALIDPDTFALAQERLESNKKHASRRTIEPSILRDIVHCRECGYALYRRSTRSSARKISYYRCPGPDAWRYDGHVKCEQRSIRLDLLGHIVWSEIVRLLEGPALNVSGVCKRRASLVQCPVGRPDRLSTAGGNANGIPGAFA